MRERLSVQDERKMGGGTQVNQVLVSSTLHLETGQLVAVKVDPATATACSPGSHQKEVRNSLGLAGQLEIQVISSIFKGYYC